VGGSYSAKPLGGSMAYGVHRDNNMHSISDFNIIAFVARREFVDAIVESLISSDSVSPTSHS
jgi:hypothetical protein